MKRRFRHRGLPLRRAILVWMQTPTRPRCWKDHSPSRIAAVIRIAKRRVEIYSSAQHAKAYTTVRFRVNEVIGSDIRRCASKCPQSLRRSSSRLNRSRLRGARITRRLSCLLHYPRHLLPERWKEFRFGSSELRVKGNSEHYVIHTGTHEGFWYTAMRVEIFVRDFVRYAFFRSRDDG
jgi:hypothetical protein